MWAGGCGVKAYRCLTTHPFYQASTSSLRSLPEALGDAAIDDDNGMARNDGATEVLLRRCLPCIASYIVPHPHPASTDPPILTHICSPTVYPSSKGSAEWEGRSVASSLFGGYRRISITHSNPQAGTLFRLSYFLISNIVDPLSIFRFSVGRERSSPFPFVCHSKKHYRTWSRDCSGAEEIISRNE